MFSRSTGGSSLSLAESALYGALYGLGLALVTSPLVFAAALAHERMQSPRRRRGIAGATTLAVVAVAAALVTWAGMEMSWGAVLFLACYGAVVYAAFLERTTNRDRMPRRTSLS
jgi:sulfite exporter TauE/SafE